MRTDAGALAATCFCAWPDKDFGTLGSVLADDATFRGPLDQADDGDTCLQGPRGMGADGTSRRRGRGPGPGTCGRMPRPQPGPR